MTKAKLEDNMTWEELANHIADQIEKGISPKWKRKKFIEWFMKRKNIGHRFDWRMIYRIYIITQNLDKEGDSFTVIVGKEGSGKTTLAIQIAAWTSPETFDIKHICYNAGQYLKKIKELIALKKSGELKEKCSILLDEAALDLFSRKSMSKTNTDLSQVFFIQRILNAHVILCIPDFYGLDTIVREHRVATLITMQKSKGTYKAITGKGITCVAQNYRKYGKDVNAHPIPYGFFWTGTFTKPFPKTIDTDQYIKNKLLNIDEFVQKCMNGDVDEFKMFPIGKLAKQIGATHEKIKNMIRRGEIRGKKIGGTWYVSQKSVKDTLKLDMA